MLKINCFLAFLLSSFIVVSCLQTIWMTNAHPVESLFDSLDSYDDYDDDYLSEPNVITKKSVKTRTNNNNNNFNKKQVPMNNNQPNVKYDIKRLLMIDDKFEMMAKALIEYHKLLRLNQQLTPNQKKIILLQINDILVEMKKYFDESPENEILFNKMLHKLGNVDFTDLNGSSDSENRLPFKWGK